MRIRNLFLAVALGAVLLSQFPATALGGKTYVWKDKEGVTHITDTPPPAEYADQIKTKTAKTEAEKLAAKGDPDAQFFLIYSKAAEKGDAEGQYKLGAMYADGRGVKKDEEMASRWFMLAKAQGHAKAKDALENLEKARKARSEAAMREMDARFAAITRAAEAERKRPKLAGGSILCQIKPWLDDWVALTAAGDTNSKMAYLSDKKCRVADSREKFTLAGVYADGTVSVIIEGNKYWALANAIQ